MSQMSMQNIEVVTLSPEFKWNLEGRKKQNAIDQLGNPDTTAHAIFIIENLTKKNEENLKLWVSVIKMFGWLSEETASCFDVVIEDRSKAIANAMNKGTLKATKYCGTTKTARLPIGVAICELINSGYPSEFFSSLKSEVENFEFK